MHEDIDPLTFSASMTSVGEICLGSKGLFSSLSIVDGVDSFPV
jgi:hypothetical protein